MNKTNPPLANTLITREATLADDEALRELIAVPMTTKGIQISFQREPSYFKASDIVYRHKLHVVIEDTESQRKWPVIAMVIVRVISIGTFKTYAMLEIYG